MVSSVAVDCDELSPNLLTERARRVGDGPAFPSSHNLVSLATWRYARYHVAGCWPSPGDVAGLQMWQGVPGLRFLQLVFRRGIEIPLPQRSQSLNEGDDPCA
jgi:hypothetical protein